MTRQLLLSFCPDCGAKLVRTASRLYCCPNGHGRLQPPKLDRRSGPYPAALPAKEYGRVYCLTGPGAVDGLFRTAVARPSKRTYTWRVTARLPAEVVEDSWVIAWHNGRLKWFRPVG
jgi:hypothetical protein